MEFFDTKLCEMERGLFCENNTIVLENNSINIIEDDNNSINENNNNLDYNKYEYISSETIFTDTAGFDLEYINNNGIYLQTYRDGNSQGGYVITPKNTLYRVNCELYDEFEMEYLPNYKIVHLMNEPRNIIVVSKYYIPYENEIELDMELFWIKNGEKFKIIQKIEENENFD